MGRIYSIFIAAMLLHLFSCTNPQPQARSSKNIADSTENRLVKIDGKQPLRLLSERPYNLETPLHYFLKDFTPNDAFFVRWHLSELPKTVNTDTFRLRISGNVRRHCAFSIQDLREQFQPVTMAALCQCAGNARSCFKPRVAGAQWVNGGMGNARWKGVRVKDLLNAAGVVPGSKFVSFNGLDAPPLYTTPDFVKSLPLSVIMNEDVFVAYEMNGDSIPLLNGYPLKLVVPGWYATYWVGMLCDITVHADTFKGFWMNKAYKVPKGVENGNEGPDALATETVPIGKMDVRSIFVFPEPGAKFMVGNPVAVQGVAFDGGDSITRVELSIDSGQTWTYAKLDPSIGRYSWRRWRFTFVPREKRRYQLMVKATNALGQTQPIHQWNRSGYMRNEIETLELIAK